MIFTSVRVSVLSKTSSITLIAAAVRRTIRLARERTAAALCLALLSTVQLGVVRAVAEANPGDEVIFDFDGHRIALERKYAGIAHFDRNDATIKVWRVEPPYDRPVTYMVTGLPRSPEFGCDRTRMTISARERLPFPLSEPDWMSVEAESTDHTGIVRLTESLQGHPDQLGGLDRFRLEAEGLRASSGNFPLLACSPAACNAVIEIERPFFAKVAYSPAFCSLKDVIAALLKTKLELQRRIIH